jgi:hypothetical protein
MREVDRRLGSVDDLLETYGFVAAREADWTTADVVHELPGPLAKVHLAVLDRTTGFVNRVMLIG